MNTLKQNIALIVGLSIPVLMMLVIAGVIYLPRVFNPIPPAQYDFLYAEGDGVVYGTPYMNGVTYPYPSKAGVAYPYPTNGIWPKYFYRVTDGKLTRQEAGPIPSEYGIIPTGDVSPKFYVHHVSTNTNTPVTFEEAALYMLATGPKSPDGYDIIRGQGGGGMFPFFYDGGNNYNKQYLHKEHSAEEIQLNLSDNYYGEFFIAWIVKKDK